MDILRGSKFDKFISENRERTINFLKSKFEVLSEDDIKDVYQESSMALYINIETGKLTELKSSLYTYFLRICINQSQKAIRSLNNKTSISIDINQKNRISEYKLNEILLVSLLLQKFQILQNKKQLLKK